MYRVLKQIEIEYEDSYCTDYQLADTVTFKTIIELCRNYENEHVRFLECKCRTFGEELGHDYCTTKRYKSIEEMNSFLTLPNAFGEFNIRFVNRDNVKESFSVIAAINTSYYSVYVDKEKTE